MSLSRLASSRTSSITAYLLFIIAIATLGPLQFGYHIAELNAPYGAITCQNSGRRNGPGQSSLPQCIPMSSAQFGLVSSIFMLGGLVGALTAGPCSSKYGRLATMRLATVFLVVGPIFEATALNVVLFSVGRVLSGVGAGAASVVVPVFISEVAPPEEKGSFGALTQVAINMGILLTQVLGYFLSRGQLWRVILAVAAMIGLVQSVGLMGVTESPQWLNAHGAGQKAREILRRIRSDKHDLDGEMARWNFETPRPESPHEGEALLSPEVEQDARRGSGSRTPRGPQKDSSIGVLEILRHPLHRPAVMVVIGVMLAQQLCGINSIIMYSVFILSALLPTQSALLTVIVSTINLVTTIACAPLADRIGRRTCLLLSIAGMGTNAALLALSMQFSLPLLSGLATILFVASFALGLGPIPFILASELLPPPAVAAAQSCALASNWIATFLVAQFFPVLDAYLHHLGRVFYVFAALAGGFFVFVFFLVPESRGKKDADEVWGRVRRVE